MNRVSRFIVEVDGSGSAKVKRPLHNFELKAAAAGYQKMPVQVELSRIIISEINEQQMIWLKEVDGERKFPILIGIFEATSIDRRVKDIPRPRPLTHDLIVNTIRALKAELDSVLISSLKDHTYYASLRLKVDGEIVEVDARPSDAIAVAVTCAPPLPIYVDEEVLEGAAVP